MLMHHVIYFIFVGSFFTAVKLTFKHLLFFSAADNLRMLLGYMVEKQDKIPAWKQDNDCKPEIPKFQVRPELLDQEKRNGWLHSYPTGVCKNKK